MSFSLIIHFPQSFMVYALAHRKGDIRKKENAIQAQRIIKKSKTNAIYDSKSLGQTSQTMSFGGLLRLTFSSEFFLIFYFRITFLNLLIDIR